MNKCIKCGSYAFNLYKEGIDQGGLCDVHYWQGRAHRAEALMSVPDGAQPEQQNCKDGSCDCCWTQPEQKTAIVEAMQAQPKQEPVAWRYKPAREDNPRWEYTTNHPLDMGDGYIRPSLVEYCKCIEPLYAKEKPKLMLEKFREMEDLLEEPAQQEPATKEKIREAIVFNLPLYTTPPQRTWVGLTEDEINQAYADSYKGFPLHESIEAKLKAKNERKEKNT